MLLITMKLFAYKEHVTNFDIEDYFESGPGRLICTGLSPSTDPLKKYWPGS